MQQGAEGQEGLVNMRGLRTKNTKKAEGCEKISRMHSTSGTRKIKVSCWQVTRQDCFDSKCCCFVVVLPIPLCKVYDLVLLIGTATCRSAAAAPVLLGAVLLHALIDTSITGGEPVRGGADTLSAVYDTCYLHCSIS
jgi:hypothetical protein